MIEITITIYKIILDIMVMFMITLTVRRMLADIFNVNIMLITQLRNIRTNPRRINYIERDQHLLKGLMKAIGIKIINE